MATTPNHIHSLLALPFSCSTDFTELADNCERFAEVLVETHEPAEKLALCGKLSSCLNLLRTTLHEPIPAHLTESLTVEFLPYIPEFAPESDALCRYCEELTRLLINGSLSTDQSRVMGDLLLDLVTFFAERLKAPRWIKTGQGIIALDALN